MKRILQKQLERVFSTLLMMSAMLVVGLGEAKAWIVTYLDDARFDLDYGSALILKAGTYGTGDPIGNPDDGVYYSTNQEMILEIPKGFRLDSLTINGKDYMSHDPMNPHTAKKYFDVRDSWPGSNPDPEVPGIWVVKATIVPDIITSPEILVDILNVYVPGSAHVEGDRVVLDQDVIYTEKDNPHEFELGEGSLVIDGAGKELYFPNLRINSGNVTWRDVFWRNPVEEASVCVVQKGGVFIVENSIVNIGFYSSFIEQEGGLLRMDNSLVSGGNESDFIISLKGQEAKTEILGGVIDDWCSNIIVEAGLLGVKGGKINPTPILMKGGSLVMTDGYVENIDVEADSEISLGGGYVGGINFYNGTTLLPTSALLSEGSMFASEYMGMIYPLGRELDSHKTDKGQGYTCGMIVPYTDQMGKTAVYEAEEKADIGPTGKDVKVNGNTYEIYTSEGLCWLTVVTNDDVYNRFENGKEYCPVSTRDIDTLKVMNDLDMTNYSEGWLGIWLGSNILDGNGHRIFNLDVTGKGTCFIGFIGKDGVAANLTVEGGFRITELDLFGNGAAFIGVNEGLAVNCAFIGSIYSEVAGDINISGFVVVIMAGE